MGLTEDSDLLLYADCNTSFISFDRGLFSYCMAYSLTGKVFQNDSEVVENLTQRQNFIQVFLLLTITAVIFIIALELVLTCSVEI